jgi:hypothetical protein
MFLDIANILDHPVPMVKDLMWKLKYSNDGDFRTVTN